MLLGRVVGTVVPAVVYEGLAGVPMLLVQPLDKTGEPEGRTLVAADATRMAGPGELVYYEGGREAAWRSTRGSSPSITPSSASWTMCSGSRDDHRNGHRPHPRDDRPRVLPGEEAAARRARGRGRASDGRLPHRRGHRGTPASGQRVLVLDEGTGARQVIGSADAPVRSVIVGIVDAVHTTDVAASGTPIALQRRTRWPLS